MTIRKLRKQYFPRLFVWPDTPLGFVFILCCYASFLLFNAITIWVLVIGISIMIEIIFQKKYKNIYIEYITAIKNNQLDIQYKKKPFMIDTYILSGYYLTGITVFTFTYLPLKIVLESYANKKLIEPFINSTGKIEFAILFIIVIHGVMGYSYTKSIAKRILK